MHRRINRIFLALSLAFIASLARAQDSSGTKKVNMADFMRNNGKIYVVVAVLVIILFGLVLYISRLDRKISRMEKNAGR